ncbi:coiled-coil domain-containing protein [Candidatus Laterigemmans baculatus]|uniref:hypothetical protein n=1 Tax=Candidatus Laterigemmans baculatus TaxID=2770505 RepID=UPI0013DAEC45|nr:hypothetical protein [Candidatus Laterigemmans baculatus]
MPVTGPAASKQIQLARRSAQAALCEARRAAALTAEESVALVEEIRQSLAALLPSLLSSSSGDGMSAAVDVAQQHLEEILHRREQHIARLDRELAQFDRERAAGEEELQRCTARIDDLHSHQQKLSESLVRHLAEDERFRAWSDAAAETEAALERAEAGLAESEYDATQKLPAYENSRLFKYLYDRRWGTSRYVAGATGRRIDDWVASLIDYPRARAGYEFLKKTPDQIRAAMAIGRDRLARLMNQLERRRDDQAVQLGLLKLVGEVHAADRQREAVLAKLEQVRQKKDATRRELAEIENPSGKYYLAVLEQIESLLEQAEQRVLKLEGASVPAPRANQILGQLHAFTARRQNIQLQAVARQQRLLALNRHLSELGYFHQRFCAADFDSRRSLFPDSFDLVGELERVRQGDDSIDLVWQRMRRRQQFHSAVRSDSPLPEVLVSAMAQAAEAEMSGYARRAATRWTHSHRGGWSPAG